MVYWFYMSKTIADQLLDIVAAVRELPSDTQEALVHEIADRVSEYAQPRLSDAQRFEITRRLTDPSPTYASPEKIQSFFSRFGIRSA